MLKAELSTFCHKKSAS